VRRLLCLCGLMMVLVMTSTMVHAAADAPLSGEIPPELGRWRSWVLHGHEEKLCPTAYNDGAVARCQWPSRLEIKATAEGAEFEQRWMMFAAGWVPLPGNAELWPDGVVVDGRPAAVVGREDLPSVRLEPGEHRLKGRFYWSDMPEMMHVPPAVGLLALSVDGRSIADPVMDAKGQLWLRQRESRAGAEDRLKVQLFRLIDDTIPMQITTVLRMDVSGQAREIRLKDVLLQNAVPMELTSALPARLDAEGQLLVQARPGRWQVRILARMPEAVARISAGAAPYGDEVWSFEPRHDLRIVEIQGLPQVEPGQTEMPDAWRGWPAFLVKAGAVMQFKEIRRGDPDPAPDQLTLFRRWWLDFDGQGFTINDHIQGTLSRQWYLAMEAPAVLGRVAVDGRDQVITAHGPEPKAGVELRQGKLELQGDARLPRHWTGLNAVGWDHDFNKVSGELYLPPGWRLLAATGVDQASRTWFQRWSLLDFFLVLIIALAVFKLRGWRWGLLALATMALIYHEPGAPRLVWLHILAVLALLPLLPAGWIKRLIALWGVGAVAALLLMTLPFVVHQVRWGLYPQLAPHSDYGYFPSGGARPDRLAAMKEVQQPAASAPMSKAPLSSLDYRQSGISPPEPREQAAEAVWHQDPDALIPTGPGLPDWQWNTITLTWNGPVAKEQRMRLFLLSPGVNLLLALIRVALLGLLIWGVVDWKPWWRNIRQHLKSGAVMALAWIAIGTMYGVPARAADTAFPPSQMLDALRQRVLEPPDCLPYCADISRMEITVSGDDLQLMLKVNAGDQTAIPLPVHRKSWTPEQILLDEAPIAGLARDADGAMWAVVPAGLHTLVMVGSVAQEAMVVIPLPLKPHITTCQAQGWELKGILPDGTAGSSLQLTRLQAQGAAGGVARPSGALPVFLQVRRVLHLGLTWRVDTVVERVTPPGAPVVAGIPLLADEALTTAGLPVDQGKVLINMPADQRRIEFTSTLKITPRIELTAPRTVPWAETWILDASPIWHCRLEGIAPIHHQDQDGRWQPQWQPWPGESAFIRIERPQAMAGQVLTLQKADLNLTPGQRFGQGELILAVNSSRGGQQTVELPPKTNLQGVLVNGKSLPVRQDGQWVTVPLQPGLQSVSIQWHQLAPFSVLYRAPVIKIGKEAVNARVSVHMPGKRWILLAGGPRWGPAVLFWSYLVVIVLAAVGLGRATLAPLKTWQWVLLGMGLTQVPAPLALIIVGWLLALRLREQRAMPAHWLGFNALQVGLAVLTLAALICLFEAVKAGLIGNPEMQIVGNNSSAWTLNWTQDRVADTLPRPWVFSLPIWSYRGLMLAWSLWLAFALLAWIKWGWHCFARDGVWKKAPPRAKKMAAPKGGATQK
jgi:hypothetical protein